MWCPCGTDQKFGIFVIFRSRASPREAMPSAFRLPRRAAAVAMTQKTAGFSQKPAILISKMFEIRRGARPHGVPPGRYIMRPQGRIS